MVSKSFTKHFVKWINSPLLLYLLFSKAPTDFAVAHLLTGSTCNKNDDYYNTFHEKIIRLIDFCIYERTKHRLEFKICVRDGYYKE